MAVRFLSPEWLAAAADALHGATAAEGVPDLTLQQVVTGSPESGPHGPDGSDGEVAYRIRITEGAVELRPGRGPDADVIFTEDWETAAAIAAGRLSPQAAFVDGRVRVSGNVALVVAAQDGLAGIEEALAGVRAATTYGR
jgi:hypothetical protein